MPTADRTIRLSDAAWHRLQRLAQREGVTPDVAAERVLERALEPDTSRLVPVNGESVLDLVADLVGTFDGPHDLSTNKAYMEGFGERRASLTSVQPPASSDA